MLARFDELRRALQRLLPETADLTPPWTPNSKVTLPNVAKGIVAFYHIL
jgi:hypothetical protein